jgi:L-threonylcarbamoyladenylate synthase
VVPTETVYGLVTKPETACVRRMFELKGRSEDKTCQLLIPSPGWIGRLALDPPADALALAEAFWPGPLTIVVAANTEAPDAVVAADGTVGLRVPAHPVALDLLRLTGPVAGSSANASGEQTPPDVAGVVRIFGDGVDGYLDGGVARGKGSTVVRIVGDERRVLRAGDVAVDDVVRVAGGRFEAP